VKTGALLLPLAMGLIGCGDQLPTSVTSPAPWALAAEQVSGLQAVLADARDRLVPALTDRALAELVEPALLAGSASLDARDREQFVGALERAKTAIRGWATAWDPASGAAADAHEDPPADAPIVESLKLVIDLTEAAALGERT
jgi:hypothetical protein